jgi:hypothetical protein
VGGGVDPAGSGIGSPVRFVNPFKLREHARNLRRVAAGGGPRSVHLVRVGEPRGLIVQSSELVVEVQARDGTKVRLDPQVPLPFILGWGIRLARALRVPLISDVRPEHLSFRLGASR